MALTHKEFPSLKFEEAVYPLSDDPIISYLTILFQKNRIRSHHALRYQLKCQDCKRMIRQQMTGICFFIKINKVEENMCK